MRLDSILSSRIPSDQAHDSPSRFCASVGLHHRRAMTQDEFEKRYEVARPVPEPGMQSAVARDRRTKAVLLAHFVGSAVTPENRSLLASLDALGPEDRKKIIEILD